MSILAYILAFSLVGSIGALTGAGILLAFPKLHNRMKLPLLSYAIGTLLGATFLSLLPNTIESMDTGRALEFVLAGFLIFFVIEKIVRIPHQHAHTTAHHGPENHTETARPAGILILIGDGFHNFLDGILIASSFAFSIPVGIVTALAVVAHEIPQELGDFVILIESGMEKWKAYWANFASALTTLLGAVLTYWFRESIESYIPFILAMAASSFLYIATVDLAPILHHYTGVKNGLKQTAGLIIGILTIIGIHIVLE